jgi:hypothetical protein
MVATPAMMATPSSLASPSNPGREGAIRRPREKQFPGSRHTLSPVCDDPGVIVPRRGIDWRGFKDTHVGPSALQAPSPGDPDAGEPWRSPEAELSGPIHPRSSYP